jgi:hypothetical protein
MKQIWHSEGAIWTKVTDRHDQLLGTYETPQPMNVQTVESRHVSDVSRHDQKSADGGKGGFLRKLPRFHRQLYTAVTGARCCG